MKKIITCLAALLLTLTGCSALAQSVTVTFYDMGKADAALVTTETGARILIDAGTNKGGKKLAERFAGEGIDRIDLMIITHFDKDHVGGADKVLESVSVAQVVMPQYAKESKQYTQFRDALSQSPQTRVEILTAGSEWSAGFRKNASARNRRRTDGLRRGRGERFFSGDICDLWRNEIPFSRRRGGRAADRASARGRYRLRRAESAVSRADCGREHGVFDGLFTEDCVHSGQ